MRAFAPTAKGATPPPGNLMDSPLATAWAGRIANVANPAVVVIATIAWILFVVITLRGVIFEGSMIDSGSYWAAGQALLAGSDPYQAEVQANGYPSALYPPIFAIASIPFAVVPLMVAQVGWYLLSLVFLAAGIWCSYRLLGHDAVLGFRRTGTLALMALLVVGFYPVWTNAKLGQVGALLFALVAAALLAQKLGRPTLGGILLGIACAIKLPPIVLIAYAVWVGWRRFGMSALASFIGLQLISAVAYPPLVVEYWLQVVPTLNERVPQDINLAPAHLVAVLAPQVDPKALLLVTLAGGLALLLPFVLVWRVRSSQARLEGAALLLLGSSIAAPLVESHHLLWLLIPLWMLIVRFIQRRNVGGGVALAGIFLLLSQPFRVGRVLAVLAPASVSSDFLGGAVLEVGGLLLYCLVLLVMLRQRTLTTSQTAQVVAET